MRDWLHQNPNAAKLRLIFRPTRPRYAFSTLWIFCRGANIGATDDAEKADFDSGNHGRIQHLILLDNKRDVFRLVYILLSKKDSYLVNDLGKCF